MPIDIERSSTFKWCKNQLVLDCRNDRQRWQRPASNATTAHLEREAILHFFRPNLILRILQLILNRSICKSFEEDDWNSVQTISKLSQKFEILKMLNFETKSWPVARHAPMPALEILRIKKRWNILGQKKIQNYNILTTMM